MSEPTVEHNETEHHYDLVLDGSTIGHINYRNSGQHRVILQTKVDEEHGGKGYGSLLVRQTLDQIRAEGKRAVTLCPMAAKVVQKNAEYHDMVDPEHVLHS